MAGVSDTVTIDFVVTEETRAAILREIRDAMREAFDAGFDFCSSETDGPSSDAEKAAEFEAWFERRLAKVSAEE
jgi:hypothetical protein